MKRKTDNFNKFFNRKRNSAVKEEFRQEKKAAKKERKEGIERHFEEKRKAKEAKYQGGQAETPPHSRNIPKSQNPEFSKSQHPDPSKSQNTNTPQSQNTPPSPDLLPLNKYIAHGGICSRRDAAELIKLGKVSVNGKPVTEPGTKVAPTDLVKVNGKKVTMSRNFVYILLNKPKDYITTTDDPQGRKTVLDLTRQATTERVYPVGRLDRNTSGVLLLTNDGDLAQKLAHPKHEIKKIYHVVLDKPLTKADFDKIAAGVTLDDGIAYVDALAYADIKDKTQIGIEIHSGRNRIVRRIFEQLGYDVRGLDRVMYAGLTKKNVQRGKWRFLMEKEVRILKYLNSSIKGSAQRGIPTVPEDFDDDFTPVPAKVAPAKVTPPKVTPARSAPKAAHVKSAHVKSAHIKGAPAKAKGGPAKAAPARPAYVKPRPKDAPQKPGSGAYRKRGPVSQRKSKPPKD